MQKIILIYLSFLTLTLSAANSNGKSIIDFNTRANNKPLEFVENKGQFKNSDGNIANNVYFKASYGNIDYYITNKGITYVFNKIEKEPNQKDNAENVKRFYYKLNMDLLNSKIDKSNIIIEEDNKKGGCNYFNSNNTAGILNVKAYTKITIKNIYKDIDWVIYSNVNDDIHSLKYDFIIHPQADYSNIKIKYSNAQHINLTENATKLRIESIAALIEEGNLYTYQNTNNSNKEVKSKFKIDKDNIVEFDISNYDKSKTLIIDPLVWATYYGGTDADIFNSICTDNLDNVYITGYTGSTDFPTQQLVSGYWQPTLAGSYDLVILKFDNQGILQWSTIYGGSGNDYGNSITTDNLNNIYITGTTLSADLPTLQLAGAYWQANNAGSNDMYILKFDSQGVRQWATYYGGSQNDVANSIGLNSLNDIYITGYSTSLNFPTLSKAGAYWQVSNLGDEDMLILKFNNQGVRQWATNYGGNGTDIGNSICFDSQDNVLITGYTGSPGFATLQLAGAYWQAVKSTDVDAFILKLNNQDITQWATFYGGNDEDYGTSVKTDSKDNIYILGHATTTNLSTQQLSGAYWQLSNDGGFDAFVLKFNNQGVRQWATYYGGNNNDFSSSLNIDHQDNIYITGETSSSNFPILNKSGEYYKAAKTGISDAYLVKFCNQGVREWATYYGSIAGDVGKSITVDSQNNIYFTGQCMDNAAYTSDLGNGAFFDNSWNNMTDSYILKVYFPVLAMLTPSYYTICSENNTAILLSATLPATFSWTIGNITQGITGAIAGSGTLINQILTNPGTVTGTIEYIITPVTSSGGCPEISYTITVAVTPKPSTPNINHN